MAEKLAAAPAQKLADEVEIDDPEEEGPRPGARLTKGHADPFGAAFEKAEKELAPAKDTADKPAKKAAKADIDEDEAPAEKAKPKAKAKPAEADEDAEAADKKAADADKKPAKKAAKAAPADDEAEDDAAEDDEDADEDEDKAAATKAAAKKAADTEKAKAKAPAVAKPYWPKERREAFPYQTREVQDAWLAESPVPPAHWATEHKERFAGQPREVQEAWLEHTQTMERGYGQKFEALATERKLAESIRGAVTPEIRQQMQQFGLKDESEVFKGLLHLQQLSVRDPIKYVRDFIVRNKIDPAHFMPDEEGNWPSNGQNGAHQQADIESHPAYQHLLGEVTALKGHVLGSVKATEEATAREIDTDLGRILSERDEAGNPRYPYIRLLSTTMADIIEADSERFSSMDRLAGLDEAYNLALKAFPELQQTPTRTAKPKPAPVVEDDDEAADDDAESEEDEASARLQRAATKKSKTPLAAPGTPGDPFGRAFSKAERQLGAR